MLSVSDSSVFESDSMSAASSSNSNTVNLLSLDQLTDPQQIEVCVGGEEPDGWQQLSVCFVGQK